MDWKIASQRSVVGDPVEVACLKDDQGEPLPLKVKPRKYSVEGSDEIQSRAIRMQAAMSRDSVKAIVQQGIEGKIDESAVFAEVLATGNADIFKQREIMRLELRYGIAAHNFDGQYCAPSDEWIEDVLDNSDLATALCAIVRDFNRPLAPKSSPVSATP